MTRWQSWIWNPQMVWWRRAVFQIHLWSGIVLSVYVLLASATGSIAVYRNELYVAATPAPLTVAVSGPRWSDEELTAAVQRAYPGTSILGISPGLEPNQAVSISLSSAAGRKDRLFNPYTGEDLGDAVPLAIWLVSKLLELHDDLLAGSTGRSVNGIGGMLVVALAGTGIVVWWPGIRRWRQSLTIHRNVGWRRFTWDLHSMLGFWMLGFIVLFALSGAYLGNPQWFQDLADRVDPPTIATDGERLVDQFFYWLAYLHFGRINGIGIPCRGPGLCDQATKLIWALAGLVPAVMAVTGVVMWWNRAVRKTFKQRSESRQDLQRE